MSNVLIFPFSNLTINSHPSADGSKIRNGFTLIELIVAIGITMLLVGGGIASFVTFNDKQSLVGSVKDLQNALRQAQLKAQLGDRPEGCDKLLGYIVSANQAAPVNVRLYARCDTGNILRSTPFTLASGVSLGSTLDARFNVLHGGVPTPQTITVNSATGYSYQFEVTEGGEITNGDFVE